MMEIKDLKIEIKTRTLAELIEAGEIKITKYLPILGKESVCNSIVEFCVRENEEGLKFVDPIRKEIIVNMGKVANYTDMKINSDYGSAIDDYDFLKSSGILSDLRSEIGDDQWDMEYILDDMITTEIDTHNSVEAVINRALNVATTVLTSVAGSTPDSKEFKSLIREIAKQVNKINPDKLEMINRLAEVIQSVPEDKQAGGE
jgi:hypothetical protein